MLLTYNFPWFKEPVKGEDDIIKFYEETGLPVALDETMDKIGEITLQKLAKFSHPGIVAIVSKHEYMFWSI